MAINPNTETLIMEAKRVYLDALDRNSGEIGDGWHEFGSRLAVLHLHCKNAPEFENHCQTIGIAPRTAYYIMKTYHAFSRLRITPPEGISWRKLAETVPVLQWENREKLFRLCREHAREELVDIVKNWRR